MDYLAVKDLKKTKELWQKLEREKELVITRDGQPSALMISVSPDTVEDSLREIRRALFAVAVARVRKRAEPDPPDAAAIESVIQTSRGERAIR
jgi:hypothetical protein